MIFADTGGFVALMREKDRFHDQAKRFVQSRPRLVTTDYVVSETVTLLLVRLGRHASLRFLRTLDTSRLLRVELVGADGYREAIEVFRDFDDKRWSLTDCSSYVVMRRLGLNEAFCFDPHFEQMGFRLVP